MAQQSNQQWGDANLVKPAGENSNTLSTPVIGDGNAPPQALVAQPPPFILLNTSAATHRAEDPPFYPGAASSPLTVMSFPPPPPPPPPAFLPNTTQSNIPHGAAALSHTHVVMPGHAPIHAHQQHHHHHHLHHHHHAHQHSVYAAATSPLFNVVYPFVQTAPHSHPSLVHQVAAQHHSPAAHGVPTFHPFPPPAGLTLPSATGPQQQLGAVLVNTESTSVPPSHTGGHHQSSGPRQLMITFLDPEVTNAELHAAFAVIGPLDAARVIYDKVSGKSKCFGFVYYHFAKDAATAMQCMSGHPIRGKRIKVIFASPQRPLPPTDM